MLSGRMEGEKQAGGETYKDNAVTKESSAVRVDLSRTQSVWSSAGG